jgi:hypothetical protein
MRLTHRQRSRLAAAASLTQILLPTFYGRTRSRTFWSSCLGYPYTVTQPEHHVSQQVSWLTGTTVLHGILVENKTNDIIN